MKVHRKYIQEFGVIEDECTAEVFSMQTVDERFFIDDANPRYLIPLKAFSIENKEYIDALLEDAPEEGIDIEDLYPFLYTGVLWANKVNHKFDLPVKGEKLIATFAYDDYGQLNCIGVITLGKVRPAKYKHYK